MIQVLTGIRGSGVWGSGSASYTGQVLAWKTDDSIDIKYTVNQFLAHSIYKVVTFYLHNYNNFQRAKEWWGLAVRKLLTVKHMIYNKRQVLEACSNLQTVHVDPSLNSTCTFHINE